MRVAVNVLLSCALAAIGNNASIAAAAERDGVGGWVPSLAVTSGITSQRLSGHQSSFAFDGETNTITPIRDSVEDDDRAVSPYVGGAIELMTPALPLLASPRFFASGEILPTFASKRQLAGEGDPSRVRGPEVGAVLAVEEDNRHFTEQRPGMQTGPRPHTQALRAEDAKGQGMKTRAEVDQLVFGAKAGIAFAFQFRGRQLRLKPSVGWIHYKLRAKGLLVDAFCPTARCTNTYNADGSNPTAGFMRESVISDRDTGVFDGVGPGIDLEMDTGRVGPLGTSIFLGFHGYYLPGDRDIDFSAIRSYDDQLSPSAALDTHTATWHERVAPWIYRAGVGVRFQWLGEGD